MGMALEALDNHEIGRAELGQNIGQRRLRLLAQFMDNGPAAARHNGDFAGTGAAMAPRILAGLIGIEIMMRMLDGRDAQAAPNEHRNDADQQRCLAGSAPARETDDAHDNLYVILRPPVPCPERECVGALPDGAGLPKKPGWPDGRFGPQSARNRNPPARLARTKAHTCAPPAQ